MKPVDLVQGTLDLLILKALALEPLHGWAIAARIRQLSNDVLLVQQGSLYPALQRLEHQGWVSAKWGVSEQNRRARFYALTRAGRRQLDKETASWERLPARALMRSAAVDDDLRSEMEGHLERLVQEHIARGLSPEAAREAARREF